MNYKIVARIAFGVTCASLGYLTAMYTLEKKYRQYADERVAANRECYEEQISELKGLCKTLDKDIEDKRETNDADEPEAEPFDEEQFLNDMPEEARAHFKEYRYAVTGASAEIKDPNINLDPFVIAPAEYGDLPNYDVEDLSYYVEDDILADDDGHRIDIEIVGRESLKTFGQYEDDSVHVRNPRLKCDYEILLDSRKYEDVYGTSV